jgi:hypothetical protein
LSPEGASVQKKVWEQLGKRLEIIQPGIMKNAGF